jgi:hypothetical protein
MKLKRLPDGPHQNEDLKRIQEVLLKKEGLVTDYFQCYELWEIYSKERCASWLTLPSEDDELFDALMENVEVEYTD